MSSCSKMNGGTRRKISGRKTIRRKKSRGGGMFDSVTSGFGSMFSSKNKDKDKEENSANTSEVLDEITSGPVSMGGRRRRRKSRRTGRKSKRTGRKSRRTGRKSRRGGRKSRR